MLLKMPAVVAKVVASNASGITVIYWSAEMAFPTFAVVTVPYKVLAATAAAAEDFYNWAY
jgi:hypothetical protein